MDETWLYHCDPETKQQSMEWRHSGSLRPKKFRVHVHHHTMDAEQSNAYLRRPPQPNKTAEYCLKSRLGRSIFYLSLTSSRSTPTGYATVCSGFSTEQRL
jgi:hypothetical protein